MLAQGFLHQLHDRIKDKCRVDQHYSYKEEDRTDGGQGKGESPIDGIH